MDEWEMDGDWNGNINQGKGGKKGAREGIQRERAKIKGYLRGSMEI